MLKKISFIILLLNLLNHCDYKPVYSQQNKVDYKIVITSFTGDKEINNLISSILKRNSKINSNKILNISGLRNSLEFVNHKILDCMGDLFLSGYKIIGSVKCSQGGHKLTNQLLKKVFSDNSNYSLIEIKGKQLPHTFTNYQNLKDIA